MCNEVKFRNLTVDEIQHLTNAGSWSEDWSRVKVADPFRIEHVRSCRFGGDIFIESGAYLFDSTIINYHIGEDAQVISTVRMECRHSSTFGNGVDVATVNENGGRTVRIHELMTAQTAYVTAMYRHRPRMVELFTAWADEVAESRRSTIGHIGKRSHIVGVRFVREVNIGNDVVIEGASLLENGTLLDGVKVGMDVKCRDFIAVEGARIELGAIVVRSFVGEGVKLGNSFTAVDSLFFANSHCEHGEACSIFAGPYTVSHHKSSLLIAGIFSFYNAGSGTNQSNHLFKSGPVHQAVHRRGCKSASNGYVMAPADEGEFTTVLGRHTKHHDTSEIPFSYLIESRGESLLMPGFALRSSGTLRDIAKWPKRDNRKVYRDIISFNEHTPLLAYKVHRAIGILNALQATSPDEDVFAYNGTHIKSSMLIRGISLYEKFFAASLAEMLKCGSSKPTKAGRWVDLAGQYVEQKYVETLLDSVENGVISVKDVDSHLRDFAAKYDDKAHGWALAMLAQKLGHTPSDEEISQAIAEGEVALKSLRDIAEADRQNDNSRSTSIGYGIDADGGAVRDADFESVRGIKLG